MKGKTSHLVVEPALRIQVIKERTVSLASPEIHIRDFKIRPNYQGGGVYT